jgi:hypothetical protein
MKTARLILLFGATAALCACAAPKKKTVTPAGPHLIGTVAFINQPAGFVLVDVGTVYAPAAGTALKCYSGGQETAVLATTPERKIPFISADIVKGTPGQGDQVYE